MALDIRLYDLRSGRTIQQQRELDLRGGEEVTLVADIEAPESTYRADVLAQYPPR